MGIWMIIFIAMIAIGFAGIIFEDVYPFTSKTNKILVDIGTTISVIGLFGVLCVIGISIVK